MQYRVHRGERLSEIGLGCYALSGAYGPRDPESFVDLLRQAYARGVTFFDTAGIYGPAEEILGRAVAPFRDQVWIATKVGARDDGRRDCSAEQVLASCEQSLRRLNTNCPSSWPQLSASASSPWTSWALSPSPRPARS